jgi:hypothetical protein
VKGGLAETAVGSTVLLVGGAVASAVILTTRNGPPQGFLAYAASVLWAFFGIVVNQYDASAFTTVAASVCLVLAAVVLVGFARPRWGSGESAPRVA